MAKLNVNPNRMELLKLKRRTQFAVRGHKLLKDKQEGLMQEFMRVLHQVQGLYQEVEQELRPLGLRFAEAQAVSSPFAVEAQLEPAPSSAKVTLTETHRAGCKLPVFELTGFQLRKSYASAMTSVAIPAMMHHLTVVFPKIILLAQVEKQIEVLSDAIEKNRRRVNALEYNLIPALKETMRDIVLKLEERDRFERTTLLKVKAMLM